MTTPDDLTAFVAARLAEDEAAARAALESEWFAHVAEFARADHYAAFGDLAVEYDQWLPDVADGAHVARHDRARALREVAAKRAVLALHHAALYEGRNSDGDERSDYFCNECDLEKFPCRTVGLLAAVWSDHPDYRAEWAPDGRGR
jgi:hypothetical protein